MLRFQSGDEAAFARLYEANLRTVLNIVYRYLGNVAEAEDLAQEVFLRVYRSRDRYSPQARFTTWLYRITANICLNHKRDKKRHAVEALAPRGASGDEYDRAELEDHRDRVGAELPAHGELERDVLAAIEALPDNQRMAVILSRYEELPYKDIALVMDVTEKAVKSLLHRARHSLRERLRKHIE
jgi:RNA polymerase sigma-70 factor (ECF subfamily)